MPLTKVQSQGIQTTDTSYSISTSNAVAVYVDSSQNVGIGTTAPGAKVDIQGSSLQLQVKNNSGSGIGRLNIVSTTNDGYQYCGIGLVGAATNEIMNVTGNALAFSVPQGSERMRITSDGQMWKSYTSQIFTASAYQFGVSFPGSSSQGIVIKNTENNQAGAAIRFVDYLGNYSGGGIYFQTSGSITYGTTSDYRVKKDVQPITNGLSTITSLNPVSFKWKADDTKGEGFIAHELAEYIPNAVIGDKDAVNEDGSVKSQVVDQSKIIAHLVAAVKELKAEIEQLKASK